MEPDFFSDGLIGEFEGLPDEVVATERTGWSAERAARLAAMCKTAGPVVREAIESAVRTFSAGVESRMLLATYETLFPGFLRVYEAVFRTIGVLNAMRPIPDYLQGTRSMLIDLGKDLAELRTLLGAVVEKAKAAPPPIDWNRVAEAQTAYASGETRPYHSLSAGSPDEGERP